MSTERVALNRIDNVTTQINTNLENAISSIQIEMATLNSCADNFLAHFIILFVLCPLIIVVNVLVLLTIYFVQQLHGPHDVMAALVSLADLVVGVVQIPITSIAFFFPEQIYRDINKPACSFLYSSNIILEFSLTTYLLMCIDCSLAVNFPYWYCRTVTSVRIVLVTGLVAIQMIVLHTVALVNFMEFNDRLPVLDRCTVVANFPEVYYNIYYTVFISVKLALGLVLCTQFNIIASKERSRRRKIVNILNKNFGNSGLPTTTTEKCTPVVPIICSFLFTILWFPKIVVFAIQEHTINHLGVSFCIFNEVANLLIISNSFVNPLLYSYFRPIYRESFKTIICTPPWKLGTLRQRERSMTYRVSESTSPKTYTSIYNGSTRPHVKTKTPPPTEESLSVSASTLNIPEDEKHIINISPTVENTCSEISLGRLDRAPSAFSFQLKDIVLH